MNNGIIIISCQIEFRLSNASIKNFEIFFNTDGDLEFINAISLCIEGLV